MSDLINIGLSGVQSYQTALNAIANNVSNANTAGYTRRTVTITEVPAAASGLSTSNAGFNGSNVTTVNRAWDDYKAAAARSASGDAGRADARLTWLSNAQDALNDDSTGVGQSATSFFDAATTLASDPGNSGNQQALLQQLDQTASAFNTSANGLAATSQGIAVQAQTVVGQINDALAALDKVNRALGTQASGTSAQADLEDQRDNIIDSIATNLNVTVSLASDGAATLSMADGTKLSGGIGTVGGARLAVASTSDGRLSVQAIANGKAATVVSAGGELGGLVESAGLVADKRTQLDTLATGFASALNAWQTQGTDASGNTGQPLLSGTSAASLQVTTTDPTAIASASSDGTANGNLLALSALRGTTGVEQGWSAIVTSQGQLVSSATAENSAASAQKDSTATALDAITGVDLDTEAANLLTYQNAYSGAAKVIQTAQTTMQSILDLF